MSAQTVIRCDADHCPQTYVGTPGEPWWARTAAETEHGWHVDEQGDFCPVHDPTRHDIQETEAQARYDFDCCAAPDMLGATWDTASPTVREAFRHAAVRT